MRGKLAVRGSILALGVSVSAAAQAAALFVAFDNFTYSGSVTRYATLNDARNQTNPTSGPHTIPTGINDDRRTFENARDGNIYVANQANNSPQNYSSDITYLSTAWYFTTFTNQVNGWGNPNNTNTGFFQYYLETNPTINGGWQPGNQQFRLIVSGGNGDGYNFARLWAAPVLGGASAITAGYFIDFLADVTANFAAPATLNMATGWYETAAMPTSFAGSIGGIFYNDNTSDPTLKGYYRFDFTVAGPGSWAASNNASWGPNANERYYPESFWAAPGAAVPEPGTAALLGLAALGLAVSRRSAAAKKYRHGR